MSELPTPLTSFVGRETEQARLSVALGQNRLVTVTGKGGCGTTRLALQTVTSTSMVTGNDPYVTREFRLASSRRTLVLVGSDSHDSGAARVDR